MTKKRKYDPNDYTSDGDWSRLDLEEFLLNECKHHERKLDIAYNPIALDPPKLKYAVMATNEDLIQWYEVYKDIDKLTEAIHNAIEYIILLKK